MTDSASTTGTTIDTDTHLANEWTGGGSAALETYAPGAATAFTRLVGVRPSGVHDELLRAPEVAAFAEQFGADVAGVDQELRNALALATGTHLFVVTQMVWIADVAPRLRSALDALFGESAWPSPRRHPVADPWESVEVFLTEVARMSALDDTTTELIRLRGARQHDCAVCQSRRSAAAIEAGATEAMFAAVDDHTTSDLPEATRAALALVDAMIWTPDAIDEAVVVGVRRHLTPTQAVELVLDVVRNAANKIAVALDADTPEVTDGVQLFTVDLDGVVQTRA